MRVSRRDQDSQARLIGGRPLLLLGVLLIVVGIQLLTLGLLGEMVAATRQEVRRPQSADLQVERVVDGTGRRD